MKKVLLFSVIFLLSAMITFAYETVIIHFPDGELWKPAYYKKVGNEALLQYVSGNDTSENWTRSIVVHSYNNTQYPINVFIRNNAMRLQKTNPTGAYKMIKSSENDAIMTRCTNDYKNIIGQCEFFRATVAHGGVITVHYMNKNKTDFKNNYTLWLEIIRKVKFLNTYYRDERTLNKAEYFEL